MVSSISAELNTYMRLYRSLIYNKFFIFMSLVIIREEVTFFNWIGPTKFAISRCVLDLCESGGLLKGFSAFLPRSSKIGAGTVNCQEQ